MATLADSGRIDTVQVDNGLARLRAAWETLKATASANVQLPDADINIDLFDRMQLEAAIGVCRASRSQADAGRKLFEHSRRLKDNPNDSDRIRKYLGRFGLTWEEVRK